MKEQNRCSNCAHNKYCMVGGACSNEGYKFFMSEKQSQEMTKIEGTYHESR